MRKRERAIWDTLNNLHQYDTHTCVQLKWHILFDFFADGMELPPKPKLLVDCQKGLNKPRGIYNQPKVDQVGVQKKVDVPVVLSEVQLPAHVKIPTPTPFHIATPRVELSHFPEPEVKDHQEAGCHDTSQVLHLFLSTSFLLNFQVLVRFQTLFPRTDV